MPPNACPDVVRLTEAAANRTMDLVENATPLVNGMANEAQALSVDWGRFMRREVGAEEFRELARRVDSFLSRSEQENRTVSSNLNDILLAQDYQDLTGQVIKRVTQLVTEVESNLLKLVLMAGQVDRFAGIEHDREAILSKKIHKNISPRVKVRRFMPINVKTLCQVRMT